VTRERRSRRIDAGWHLSSEAADDRHKRGSEAHPFTDGNGRIARILMNAELTTTGAHRIIKPIVYRDDYIQSLRALSRNANPTPLLRVLNVAQDYTSRIDWSTLDDAEQTLHDTHAFLESSEADELGVRLVLPGG